MEFPDRTVKDHRIAVDMDFPRTRRVTTSAMVGRVKFACLENVRSTASFGPASPPKAVLPTRQALIAKPSVSLTYSPNVLPLTGAQTARLFGRPCSAAG